MKYQFPTNLKNDNNNRLATNLLAVAFLISLNGCSAIHTAIAKKNLDVQTKMSDTIFLNPVTPDKKIIFVDIKNTSDKSNFDIQNSINHVLITKGYKVTNNPDAAHYWLRANILSVDKANPTAAEIALNSGFGGSLTGIAVGAATGGAIGGWAGAGLGGLAGAAAFSVAETVADAAVEDVTYMVITDLEVAERAKDGVIVRQDSQQNLKQGIGGARTQISSEITDRKQYRARIVSIANKMNLDFAEAAPELESGLAQTISGIF
jgi:hypothetical protein